MGVSVSLVVLLLGIFAFFGVKCALIYAALRKETALAWITGSLMLGVAYMIVYDLWPSDRVEQLATFIVTPLSFYCVAQSIRLLAKQPPLGHSFWGTIAALVAAEILLVSVGVPYLVPMAMFQATATAAVLKCMQQLWRASPRHPLDWPLFAGLGIVAAVFTVRLPAWLLLAPVGISYHSLRALPVDAFLLTVSGMTSSLVAVLLVARGLSDLFVDLRDRSERDGLTGLLNRTAFDQRLATPPCGALVLADIDHFKTINDRHGHGMGDAVIRSFARLLSDTGHPCARVGGEEFVLWIPGRDTDAARETANRLRRKFQARSSPGLAADHRLTASFGLAWLDDGDCLADAYHRADAALYRAKAAGRDRVELCPVALERMAA